METAGSFISTAEDGRGQARGLESSCLGLNPSSTSLQPCSPGKLALLPEPQFPHLSGGDESVQGDVGRLRWTLEMVRIKRVRQDTW